MRQPKSEYAANVSTIVLRRNIQRRLEAIAIKHGAIIIENEELRSRSETTLNLSFQDWRMNCDLDAKCPSGVFMGNWHTVHGSTAHYDRGFAAVIGGTVNTHHFRKATIIEASLENFLERIDNALNYLEKHKTLLHPLEPANYPKSA